MTIQLRLGVGNNIRTYTYRKVYIGVNYGQHVESFWELRDGYEWGVMIKLRGKEQKMLHSFGIVPKGVLERYGK